MCLKTPTRAISLAAACPAHHTLSPQYADVCRVNGRTSRTAPCVGMTSKEPRAEPATPLHLRAFIAELGPSTPPTPVNTASEETETWNTASNNSRSILRLIFRNSTDRRCMDLTPGARLTFLLGSEADWEAESRSESNASAATVCWDSATRQLTISSSIIGLPPIFLYRSGRRTVVASDLWLLRSWPGVELAFDAHSIEQVCRIGYPVGFRTLFKGVTVVPGGTRIDVDDCGGVTIGAMWRMPPASPVQRWEELTDLQAALFRKAVRHINVEAAFLSLTGGLDTRAIVAAMLEAGRTIPAYTMGWKDVSLDARLASGLCRPYGIPHEVVSFDESFATEIAGQAMVASRLSGGLAAIEQAIEVAFYKRVGKGWRSRVSGYLGNQVGRGGQEHTSLRHGDVAMFTDSIVAPRDVDDDDFGVGAPHAATDPYSRFLQRTLFASIGNYCVGHHFADQASPYASRRLVESLACMPLDGSISAKSALRMRLRDLRHRFLGESIGRSFQRQVIASVGGHVAEHPINWGWRAAGGVSVVGLAQGVLALVDTYASSRVPLATAGRRVSGSSIVGRHRADQPRLWWSRDLLHSVLLDKAARESGLFSVPTIRRKLEEHFAGVRDHFNDLLLAAELAYAHEAFLVSR
jgi:hypothetical protein